MLPDTRIHFIAGLPRSGSTLLAAILRQNPRFHAAMSSPLEHMYTALLAGMSGQNFFHRSITDTQRKRLLHGLFDNYYSETDAAVIFDTNRNWPAKLPSLSGLFPDAKIICCVRDLAAVVNSFEHLVAQNPFTVSRLFGYDAKMTVSGRVERLLHADGPVGRALAALREGWYGPHGDRIHIVEYETLVSSPEETVGAIYDAIGETRFMHDFGNVEYAASEFDEGLGFPGMHTVRRSVGAEKKALIIPDDILAQLRDAEFWRRPRGAYPG
jgi:sulfotransferase